jgi:hypothetical protein
MRLLLKACAGLVLVLLTAGCLVETDTSLSDPDAKAMDPALLGTWYHATRDEADLFSVAKDPQQPGRYRIVYTAIRADSREKPVRTAYYVAWRTVIAGHSYLNIRRTGGTDLDRPAATIVSYDLGADGTLVLRLFDTKQVIAAIKAGRLKGQFKEQSYSAEATITSPRDELVAFLAKAEHGALFAQKTAPLRKLVESAR